MMLQPWMGSDLTNDDLVKESSMFDDYTHTLRGFKDVDGVKAYRVEFHAEAQGTEHRTHDLRPGSTAIAEACMKYKRHIVMLTRKYPDRLPGHGFPILRDSDILIFLNDNPGVSRL